MNASRFNPTTKELVAAYNAAEVDGFDRKVLHDWLEEYVKWFSQNGNEFFNEGVAEEYAILSLVTPKDRQDNTLLTGALTSFGDLIQAQNFPNDEIMASLDCFLKNTDPEIFDGNTTQLLGLAQILLSKLKASGNVFDKGAYRTHSATLSALHQVVLLIGRVARDELHPENSEGPFQTFKSELKKIKNCSSYFPIRFEVQLIEQSLQRLARAPDFDAGRVSRRVTCGLSGCLYLYRGLRSLAFANIDVISFERAYERLREACTTKTIKLGEWYGLLTELEEAAALFIQDGNKHDIFLDSLNHVIEAQRLLRNRSKRKLIRYGIIRCLLLVGLNGTEDFVRSTASQKLIELGSDDVKSRAWGRDPDIFEALLQALLRIQAGNNNSEGASSALEFMASLNKTLHKEIVDEWLRNQSLEEGPSRRTQPTPLLPSGYLFTVIQKQIEDDYAAENRRGQGRQWMPIFIIHNIFQRTSEIRRSWQRVRSAANNGLNYISASSLVDLVRSCRNEGVVTILSKQISQTAASVSLATDRTANVSRSDSSSVSAAANQLWTMCKERTQGLLPVLQSTSKDWLHLSVFEPSHNQVADKREQERIWAATESAQLEGKVIAEYWIRPARSFE